MEMHGWGRYPRLDCHATQPKTAAECAHTVASVGSLIARGLGRSYGDSSLAEEVLQTRYLDQMLEFDAGQGLLTCAAGVSLQEILQTFVPRGWFLPVTPGTRFVTVGGAIASDVHGKNHHAAGSFSRHVSAMEILLGNGECVIATPTQRRDLFESTCGGMGLTGVILKASLRLQRVRSSLIRVTTVKAPDLQTALYEFERNESATYSVAWIDCLARGRSLGRSILMLGEHANEGPLVVSAAQPRSVHLEFTGALVNAFTVRMFNALYFHKNFRATRSRMVPLEPYFYPLDALADWNRLYGRRGFLQYQFVIPKEAGPAGLRGLIERIAASGQGSFLAVLKLLGRGNGYPLSFPFEGYTLALDFKAEPAVFDLLRELDSQVLDLGGRLYLAKDGRMSQATFQAGYPKWMEFEAVRAKYHAHGKFSSAQSRRLGLQ